MPNSKSFDLLVYKTAYKRHRDTIDELSNPLVMDDDGKVWRGAEQVAPEQVQPRAAWANRDLYNEGPVRAFMVACLKSKNLQWMQSSAAGFEAPVFGKLVGNGVTLTNANASAVPIAEFVMAQVLSAFHPTVERLDAQRERRWQSLDFKDVFGTTWLIYGVGHVGTEIALRAKAFGATVIGARRTPSGDEPVDEMVSADALPSAFARADVIVLSAALNAHNQHLINADTVRVMKPGSVLVNIGRGGLVDEGALVTGLDVGRPGLAILDVFETEPLPEEHPLWAHPQVRLTAHCAGASPATGSRGEDIFLDNLQRFANGTPLRMQVTELGSGGP
jgi:phosphoglycerate dehydrogenase-like enzyme